MLKNTHWCVSFMKFINKVYGILLHIYAAYFNNCSFCSDSIRYGSISQRPANPISFIYPKSWLWWHDMKKISWRGKKNEITCRDKGVEMYDLVIIFNWPCLNLILHCRIKWLSIFCVTRWLFMCLSGSRRLWLSENGVGCRQMRLWSEKHQNISDHLQRMKSAPPPASPSPAWEHSAASVHMFRSSIAAGSRFTVTGGSDRLLPVWHPGLWPSWEGRWLSWKR